MTLRLGWLLVGLALAGPPATATFPAADLPMFGLATSIELVPQAPFPAAQVLDRGKPPAEIQLAGPTGIRPVRVYAPAMVESLDALERAYRLAPGVTITRDDRCIRTTGGDVVNPVMVDCIVTSPSGQALNCTWEGSDPAQLKAAEAICRSIVLK